MLRPRLSIARLMGVILGASLMMCCFRNPDPFWGSSLFLVTCGVLTLGVVALVCRRKSERGWWLGFVLFGCGYLTITYLPEITGSNQLSRPSVETATHALLTKASITRDPSGPEWLWQIIRCAWTLLSAALGGLLAHTLRSREIDPSVSTAATPLADHEHRRFRRRHALIGLTGPLLVVVAILVGIRSGVWQWAGALFLLTVAFFGTTALGAVFGRQKLRAIWLGATLFGAGYLILIFAEPRYDNYSTWPRLATNSVLETLRPWIPELLMISSAEPEKVAAENARISKALDRLVPVHFSQETSLETFLDWVKTETRSPDGRTISIYVAPIDLQEAEKTMDSTLTIDLESGSLSTIMRLGLDELGMMYRVEDGILYIVNKNGSSFTNRPAYDDPYLIAGQCLLAWLAACVGGGAAYLVSDRR